MVRLVFKNVGQGDSIILEWERDNENRIGIIDCNIFQKTNPVLDHLINKKIKRVDFIILTHPHYDHFSGFTELLNYCRSNNISIRQFIHTAQTTPEFLKAACSSVQREKELINLFTLLKEMSENNELKVNAVDDNPDLIKKLNNDFSLEFLSPSHVEINKYINSVKFPFDEEVGGNNPNANWLSTVIKIYTNNYTVLLTSDVEKSTLTRIGKKSNTRLKNLKIKAAQCPHHGSNHNLNKPFWNLRKRGAETPMVISVGANNYKHPSRKVIDFFNNAPNYKIYRTDNIMRSQYLIKNEKKINELNVFSTNVTESIRPQSSDIEFDLTSNSVKLV